jgi:hypothetical protein
MDTNTLFFNKLSDLDNQLKSQDEYKILGIIPRPPKAGQPNYTLNTILLEVIRAKSKNNW